MSRATAGRPLFRDELLALERAGVLHVGVEVAARALGVSEGRARHLAASGEFPVPCFRMGRTLRVQLRGLLDLLGLDHTEEMLRAAEVAS